MKAQAEPPSYKRSCRPTGRILHNSARVGVGAGPPTSSAAIRRSSAQLSRRKRRPERLIVRSVALVSAGQMNFGPRRSTASLASTRSACVRARACVC